MFRYRSFKNIGYNNSETPAVYSYETTEDTIAQVSVSGYFSDPRAEIREGDLIIARCTDGSTTLTALNSDSIVAMPSAVDVSSAIRSTVTYTVGSGGDFTNINSALDYLLTKYKVGVSTNPLVTINLLTGFVMAEQIICDGINLGGVSITSDDAEVTITRSALATTNIANLDESSAPAFLAVNNGILPFIDCLFNMDASGTSANKHGVMVAWGGRVSMGYGSGVKNAGARGLYGVNGFAYARFTIWSGALTRGIRASNNSVFNVRDCTATGCGEYNIAIDGASSVTATGADFSGGLADNVLIDGASTLNAESSNLSGAVGVNVTIKSASTANIKSCNLNGIASTTRGIDCTASTVDMESATATGFSVSGATPVVVSKGSVVNAQSVNANTSGNSLAVSVTTSSLNFRNGTAVSTGAQQIRVFNGAIIQADGATGGLNVTKNTITASGIIFQA